MDRVVVFDLEVMGRQEKAGKANENKSFASVHKSSPCSWFPCFSSYTEPLLRDDGVHLGEGPIEEHLASIKEAWKPFSCKAPVLLLLF